jgi:hypothetical protein
MKRLAFVLTLILIINTAILSFVLYRNNQYKTDYSSLFGSDKYLIEEDGNGNIKFYVLAPKNSEEEYELFDVLKDYMKEHPLNVVYIEVDKEENTDAFDLLLEDKLDKLEYLPATVYVKDGEVIDFCEGELMPEQIEIWLYRNGIELD